MENKVTGSETKLNNQYDSPLTFTQWTPKFSLQYWLNSDNQVYVTVAKGYKTGGFNTVFESEDERTFGPETSWNYEIGAKTSFFEKKLFVEAALFYIDIKNQQIKQLLDLQGLKVHNAGNTVSKGAELSLRANPIRNLSLSASYGYTHATFKDYVYNSTVNYAGNFLPFIPKHTLSINLEKIFPYRSAISDQILFNVGYTGMGEIYWSENNETKQPFYGTLDASLGTNKGKVEFTLWAKNMTDTKYLGYYFVSSGRKLGKPGKPFTAGVSLSYSL
ncbi:MAG TPA: TonB-dependent receptor [Dysgonamonadaceae bacterium]|nr:TonB-dependent receptor [Dysgonamonadaceae bacterium]